MVKIRGHIIAELPVGHGKKSGFTFLKSKKAILGRKKPFSGYRVLYIIKKLKKSKNP